MPISHARTVLALLVAAITAVAGLASPPETHAVGPGAPLASRSR